LTGAEPSPPISWLIDKTKHNYNREQHKNLNNQTINLLTYAQITANETRAWKQTGPVVQIMGPAGGTSIHVVESKRTNISTGKADNDLTTSSKYVLKL